MKCPKCDYEHLYAEVTVKIMLPMAARLGSVKLGGQKITQVDIKKAWDLDSDGQPKPRKGPITCAGCETRWDWVSGELLPAEASVEELYDAQRADG